MKVPVLPTEVPGCNTNWEHMQVLLSAWEPLLGLLYTGTGTPEGAVTAPVGSLFMRTDGGASTTLYVKESGTAATGWVAK